MILCNGVSTLTPLPPKGMVTHKGLRGVCAPSAGQVREGKSSPLPS